MDWPADSYDIFGTHRPVLRALSRWLIHTQKPAHRVCEFGAGDYSTPLFLDKNEFPWLDSLMSLETKMEWAKKIKDAYGSDSRLQLFYGSLEPPLVDFAQRDAAQSGPFDIALIDGGNHDTRNDIAAKMLPYCKFLVIHDAEMDLHQDWVLQQKHYVLSVLEQPWTAVVGRDMMPFART